VYSFLNINRVTQSQLLLFFTRLGYDYGLADDLTQSILDWRDTDIARRARGAEREAYIELGRIVLPRDGSFQDVDELLHVMHMTPEIHDSIRPYLTVLGATGGINVNTAPEPVLRSIASFSDVAVENIVRARASGMRIRNAAALTSLTGGGNTSGVRYESPEMLVTSIGRNRGGRAPYRIEAVIRRTTGANATSTVVSRKSR
jgi:type II secretory pathway component PulK